jgi:thioredoxin 2
MQNDGNLVVTKGTTVLWSAQPLSPSSQPTASHPNLITVSDQDFQSKVLSSPTAVIVDFYAEWDGPSLMMAPTFEQFSDVCQGKLLFAKLDTDANDQTVHRCNVLNIPTFLIFEHGQEIARMVGTCPTAEFKRFIDTYIPT